MLCNPISNVFPGKPGAPPSKFDWRKFRSVGADLEALTIEVVEMLREQQRPAASQKACLRAVEVRNIQKGEAAGPEQPTAQLEETARVGDMLQNIPESDHIE